MKMSAKFNTYGSLWVLVSEDETHKNFFFRAIRGIDVEALLRRRYENRN